jgi:hypothetical protein
MSPLATPFTKIHNVNRSIMDVESDLGPFTCQHMQDLVADVSLRDTFIRKCKSMIEWSLNRASVFRHGAKRRKV